MIRSGYITILIVTIVFSGGYVYSLASLVCPTPLPYRLGSIDESFNISEAEAKQVIAEAAAIWEAEAGEPLFVYDESAAFTINFVFDERQEATDLQQSLRERLDQTQSVTEELEGRQESLLAEYDELDEQFTAAAEMYEADLAAHNARVARYNDEGGAPPEVYAELEERAAELESQRQQVNQLAGQLNRLGEEINALGEQGTAIVDTYNRGVMEYNTRFGEAREFTQGTYQQNRIDIFTFVDKAELRLVLAHELGHALTLDHVDNEESTMHFLIGGQPRELALTAEDQAEFQRVCTDYRWWDILIDGWRTILY